ncbi:phage tail length tape measure family protein [Burkholderia ubonensis]|uniref:phage tail length tape measure family protein n=1 Tax=Burkholderia ubonensis TaxID=101571 RepID=UPI000AF698BF|nr:phage tail length tape measure family protein [Burkholderia ubonensis]
MQEAASNGYNLTAREAKKLVDQYDRLQATAGKTRLEMLNQQAAARGVTQAFAAQTAAIQQATNATHSFSLNNSAARREMLVLAHEASQGQWKRFAGSMLVMAEASDALSLVMSPLGISLAAAAGAAFLFAKEIYAGYESAQQFKKAIAGTGGYLGTSTEQMLAWSNRLQDGRTSLFAIREAMAQVAATGRVMGDDLGLATRAAIGMAADIGIGTDKAAESLAKIQDDVLKWVSEYQKAHHTFNASQIEEIENFVKQGDTASAFRTVLNGIAGAHEKIAADADKHMGAVLTWWRQWGAIIDRVKGAIMNIGVPSTLTQQIGEQLAKVEQLQGALAAHSGAAVNGPNGLISAREALAIEMKKLDVLRDQQAEQFKAIRQREKDAKEGDAAVRVGEYLRSNKYATPKERQALDLQVEKEAFATATLDLDKNSAKYEEALKRHQGNITRINELYARRTRHHVNEGGLNSELARLEAANRVIEKEAKRSESTLKAQREIGLVDSETYFQRLHDIQAKALDQQIANAKQREQVASAKKEKSAYETASAAYKDLAAQREQIDKDLNSSFEKLSAQRAANVTKFSMQEAAAYGAQVDKYADERHTRFMLADEKAKYDGLTALRDQFERKMASLAESYSGPTADQKEYQERSRIAGEFYRRAVEAYQAHQEEIQAARESFGAQFKKGYADLVGSSQTTAEAVASGFRTAFDSLGSGLETFITTGKASFSSFATSVLADLAKIALRQAEIATFRSMASAFSFFSEGGPVLHRATGGPISGPGTGTSDSIPAMLSNGEFVINAASTKKYRSLLDAINSGHMAHFATGGIARSLSPSPTAMSVGGERPNLTLNLNGGGNVLTAADLKELAPQIQGLIDIQVHKRITEQGGYAYQIRNGLL